jgi:hypothetical protein
VTDDLLGDPALQDPQNPQPLLNPKPQEPAPTQLLTLDGPQPLPVPQEPKSFREQFFDISRKKQEEAERRAVANFDIASRGDADLAAEAQRVARELGVDTGTATRNIDVLRAMAAQKIARERALLARSPVLAQQFQDVEFAKIAWDDLHRWSEFERLTGGWRTGVLQVERGTLGEKLRQETATEADKDRLAAIEQELKGLPPVNSILTGTARTLGQLSQTLPESVAHGAVTGAAVMGATSVMHTGPQAPVTLPAAFLTGFGVGATAKMAQRSYQIEAGNLYRDLSLQGYSPRAASNLSMAYGLVASGLELTGMGLVTKPLRAELGRMLAEEGAEALVRPTATKAAVKFATDYVIAVGGETGTETLQRIAEIAAEEAARRATGEGAASSTVSRGEVGKSLAQTVVQTAQGMALLGGFGPGVQLMADANRVAASNKDAEDFAQIVALADAMKTRERSPEKFQKAVAQILDGSKVENVYVDARQFAEVLAQADGERTEGAARSTAEDLSAKMPGVMADAARMAESGGDVIIPSDAYLTHIAGTPLDAKLRPHVRTNQDGISPAEAEGTDLKEKVEEFKKSAEERAKFDESGAKVEQDFLVELEQTGANLTAVQKRAVGTVVRSFYETLAEDAGVLPEQLRRTRVEKDTGASGETLSQSAESEFHPDPEKFYRGFQTPDELDGLRHMDKGRIWNDPFVLEMRADPSVTQTGANDTYRGKIRPENVERIFFDVDSFTDEPIDYLAALEAQFPGVPVVRVKLNDKEDGFVIQDDILHQPDRGRIDLSRLAIMLGSQSDVSTVLHELGHAFHQLYDETAALPGAPEAVKLGQQKLLDWFGVKDQAAWNALTPEQKKRHREAVAYNFENYLWTGKAPTVELQGVFDRIAAWIRDIYRLFTGGLNGLYKKEFGTDLPALTPEVREVFDRMLAAESAIQQARAVRGQMDTFATRELFKGNDEQWAEYQALVAAQREGGVSKLTAALLKDLAWLGKSRSRIEKEIAAEAKELRKKAGAEAGQELALRPVYRLRTWLKQGKHIGPDGKPTGEREKNHYLSTTGVRDAAGVAAQDWLKALEDAHREDGQDVDVVAEQFGYETGEAMLRDLVGAPTLADAVVSRTDEIMQRDHGELLDAQSQALAVNEALDSEAASRLAASTLRWVAGLQSPDRITLAAAKETARLRLEQTPVRYIKASAYRAAAARASREAHEALNGKRASKGKDGTERPAKAPDPKAAVGALQRQLLATEMARQARRIEQDVEKRRASFDRFFQSDAQLGRTRNLDLINAGRSILAAYGLTKRAALPLSYIQQIAAYDPATAARLAPIVARATDGNTLQDYRNLKLTDFRDLTDVVTSLWDMSKRSREIEVEGKTLAINTAVQEMLAAATQAIGEAPVVTGPVTDADRKAMTFAGIKAHLRKVESWTRKLDGNQATGPWQRYLFRPLREKFSAYMRDRSRMVQRLHDELAKLDLSETKIAAPELGHTFENMAQLLGALLHTGSLSSLRKLLLGYKWATERVPGDPLTLDRTKWDAMVERLIEEGRLKKEHFDFLQAVWNLNAELKPIAQRVNHEIAGVYFNEIEAQPFENRFGRYEGGYAPAPPDPNNHANADLARRVEGDLVADMERDFRESYPAVSNSFTIDRNESTRPLLLDVRMQTRHFDQVLRFIHLQPAVRDALKLLNDPKLDGYLSKVDPKARALMLDPWLKATAANRITKPHDLPVLNTIFTFLRRSTGRAFMFLSVRNALQQATGISNASVYVQRQHLSTAFWKMHEQGIKAAQDSVTEQSVFMDTRLNDIYGQITDDIDLLLDPSKWGKVERFANRYSYVLQRMVQTRVDLVTWLGAQSQALAAGKDNATAVQEADAAVRLSQGSHATIDTAAYERGTPFSRLFTQFSGYYNTVLNQVLTAPGDERAGVIARALVIPALASAVIAALLSGGSEFDDDDEDGYTDEVAWWLLSTQVKAASGLLPGFGPAISQLLTSEKRAGDRITLAPFVTAVQATSRAFSNVAFGPTSMGGSQVRDLGIFLSAATGLPLAPVTKALGFLVEKAEGKTETNLFSGLTGNAR